MNNETPIIYLASVRIDEPVTTLTDLMVSFVCFYAFFKISNLHDKSKIGLYLKYYFLSMGIATALGGLIGHGFLYAFDAEWKLPENYIAFITKIVGEKNMNPAANPWKLPGWLTSMFSIALVERSSIEYAKKYIKPAAGRFFSRLNIVELCLFVTLTFSTLNFYFVEVHSFYGLMLIVAGFSLYRFIKSRSKGSKLFLAGIIFSAIAALFFMNQWSFHTWYNYLAASHTLMTIAAIFFYKGAIVILEG